MNQPGALLQGLEGRAEGGLVNELLQPLQVLKGRIPVLHQDFRGQLTPEAVQVISISGLDQDPMEVQVFSSI